MQGGATSHAPWTGWRQDAAIATALAVFLAVIGPFGSYLNGSFWQRLAFQLPCAWAGLIVIGVGVRLVTARFAWGPRLWCALAGVGAVAMLPVTVINIALAQLLWPFLSRVMTPLRWYGEGLLIVEPITFAFAHLARQRHARGTKREEAEKTIDERSNLGLGLLAAPPGDVLCLQMEDHYVRVHTPRGSHLVLATFGQAQDSVAGIAGLRVHRSWWVADKAVLAAERDGRNVRLVLTNGVRAPVARTSVADVRSRGWLGVDAD